MRKGEHEREMMCRLEKTSTGRGLWEGLHLGRRFPTTAGGQSASPPHLRPSSPVARRLDLSRVGAVIRSGCGDQSNWKIKKIKKRDGGVGATDYCSGRRRSRD